MNLKIDKELEKQLSQYTGILTTEQIASICIRIGLEELDADSSKLLRFIFKKPTGPIKRKKKMTKKPSIAKVPEPKENNTVSTTVATTATSFMEDLED